jgi:hypothetical protein
MRVRRRFQLALLATFLFAVAFEAIPRTINAIHTIEERHELGVANAAFARLRVPASFAAVHTGCAFYPCYFVAEPAAAVEPALPAILASVHADWRDLAYNRAPSARRPGARFGPVPGCATRARAITTCDIEGLIDGQPVTVFLGPDAARKGSLVWILSPRGYAALTTS